MGNLNNLAQILYAYSMRGKLNAGSRDQGLLYGTRRRVLHSKAPASRRTPAEPKYPNDVNKLRGNHKKGSLAYQDLTEVRSELEELGGVDSPQITVTFPNGPRFAVFSEAMFETSKSERPYQFEEGMYKDKQKDFASVWGDAQRIYGATEIVNQPSPGLSHGQATLVFERASEESLKAMEAILLEAERNRLEFTVGD
jgi:hypothetical protein